MKRKRRGVLSRGRFTSALLLCLATGIAAAEDVIIGVLSHRGDAATHAAWDPTATYLTRTLSGLRFVIRPLDFSQVEEAVASDSIAFVLVNPGIYVDLEVRHGVARLATLQYAHAGQPYNVFGGVLFTRRDRTDLISLAELQGTRLAAVAETSLGGYQMARRELLRRGWDPDRHFGQVVFSGTHDEVVRAVREGRVDVGTVRTGILENLMERGMVARDELRVLEPKAREGFPLLHSTALYPEWPIARTRHTPIELAQRVTVALLSMPAGHPAAQAGHYVGWTVPLDYQPVHDLYRELRLKPYDQPERFNLSDVWRRYWAWILVVSAGGVLLVVLTTWVSRLNRALVRAKLGLERQHELVLNAVAEGIAGVDLHGNTTFVNRAFVHLTGWQPAEIMGRNQHALLHHTRADGSAHPPTECPVYAAFHDGQTRFVDDDVFWRKDGSSFPVEYTSAPVRDESGRTVGAVVVFRDATQRRSVEEELRMRQAELAHAARLSTLGEMASGIAHELNQPLGAIANYAGSCIRMLAHDGSDPGVLREGMQRVVEQAQRAGDIIRNIRAFVRKEAPRRNAVRISKILRDALQLVRPDARRSGVRIALEVADEDPVVRVDPIQIEQVLLNLVRNAIEALMSMPAERREIGVRAAAGEEGVEVEVRDSGPGLDPADRERVFDPFFTTKSTGMGLGLSISRAIIEAHGGRLYMRPAAASGGCFCFVLPRDDGEGDD